jgi:hypothetical protein
MTGVAVALCVVAVVAVAAAIRDMVLGTGSPRRGWALRAIAVLAFVLAVLIGSART